MTDNSIESLFQLYVTRLSQVLPKIPIDNVDKLADCLLTIWRDARRLLICGNGGSAGNAIHLANDFLYGIGGGELRGMNVEALPANASVLTCLANDVGYDEVFSEQIKAKANRGDALLVLSGSGNSRNIMRALETAKENEMETHAILGYSGGECLEVVDNAIHIPINDMQISEDMQLIVGHICMRWLVTHRKLVG